MDTSVRRRRTPLTLFLLVALISAMLALPAAADHPNEPLGTPLVEPTTFAGNDACRATRINDPATGSYSFDVDGFTFEVDIITDGTYFSFDANAPVQQVIAKGGPNYNVYDYHADDLFNVRHDSGLHSPINPKNGDPYGLSHISFCFDEPIVPEGTLDVEKTAEGTYDRDITWELEKTVDPDSHTGGPGDVFSSDWQVVATKTEGDPQNFKVEGEITVGWAGDFPVSVRVDDELDDGTAADVDCDGLGGNVIDFAAGTDEVVCTYEAFPDDAEAETNFVELVVLGDPEGDITGTLNNEADIVWTETVNGDDEVLLADDRSPIGSETIDSSTTWDYDEGFECPAADSGAYVDGLYEETFENTATLTGDETDLEASAEVVMTCRMVFQGETVTGTGQNWSDVGQGKKRTNTWFQYTDATGGTHDLVQGRPLNLVGTVTITQIDADTTRLCFSLTDPWMLDPNAASNVKIEPLDDQPEAWLAPGQYTYHFDESGSDFCVDVSPGSYGYAIHLDAGHWTS